MTAAFEYLPYASHRMMFKQSAPSGNCSRMKIMASLQEKLDNFKKTFESGAPPYNAPREAIEKMRARSSGCHRGPQWNRH